MDDILRKVFNYLRIEELVALICAVILFPLNFILFGGSSPRAMFVDFARYFLPHNPFYEIFFYGVYAVLFIGVYKVLVTAVFDFIFKTKVVNKETFILALKQTLEPIRIILTLGLSIASFYFLFHNLNKFFVGTQADYLLLKADNFIFGQSPFLTIPKYVSSFSHTVLVYFYVGLGTMINAALLLTFLFAKKVFRVVFLSFIMVFVFSFPVFAILPCQDPTHFFVLNDHNYNFPPEVDAQLVSYSPSEYLMTSLRSIAEMETSFDGAAPISCIPSTHAVWAFISIFALAMISLWTLIITVPATILILTGGLYLAQHYAIDYVVAVPVTILCILSAYYLLKFEEKIKSK